MKFKLPFGRRARRRARRSDDPSEVFKTFVHVLSRMQAHARIAPSETPSAEKA
jgi:hypothetical protein